MPKHATRISDTTRPFWTRLPLPRRHLILAGVLLGLLTAASFIGSRPADASRQEIDLAINIPPEAVAEITEAITVEPIEPAIPWQEEAVRPGDNLSKLFSRAGLSATTLHGLISDGHKELTRIYPGQKLAFQIDDQGQLLALKHVRDRLNSTLYQHSAEGFTKEEQVRSPEVRTRHISGTIDSSLFLAAQKAGLSANLTMQLANVFGGVIDFVFDIRSDDAFYLIYEEHFLDGEKIGNGPILAAGFRNRGELHTAYRYLSANGQSGYYNGDGVSMRKAFLRAPLDFTRVSSGFNPNRLHPVFKTKRPHRGVDYAAPRGTPVFAAGDGRVIKSGYTKANGHYVVIQHGEQFTTKYLHLNKRAVKRLQRVKQQQIIGWVGSTGYATGPHLHYEFLVNGVHRNPRTILKKLPKAKSIATEELPQFQQQIRGLQLQLASYTGNYIVAASDDGKAAL